MQRIEPNPLADDARTRVGSERGFTRGVAEALRCAEGEAGKVRVTRYESRVGGAWASDLVTRDSSLVPSRPAFWPAAADLQRVPECERVGKAFDQVAAGCPVYEVEWTPEQLLKLYDCSSGVRRWLRFRIDRMVNHDELACILGVSGPLLEKACVLGFAKLRERFAAGQGGGR